MKRARVLTLIILCIFATFAFTASGCISSVVSGFSGSWKLDFEKCEDEYRVSDYFSDASLDIFYNKQEVDLTVEFTSKVTRCNIDKPVYVLKNLQYEGDGISCRIGDGDYPRNFYYEHNKGTIRIQGVYVYYLSEEGKEIEEYVNLCFSRTSNQNNNPKPSDKPQTNSDFEKIKTAYKGAGYTVDFSSGEVDASLKATMDQIKSIYSELGYNICYIGKNLSDPTSTELYVLISADTEAHAKEIAQTYDGTYQYAISGKDVIVSLWVISTPNFAPFNQATN